MNLTKTFKSLPATFKHIVLDNITADNTKHRQSISGLLYGRMLICSLFLTCTTMTVDHLVNNAGIASISMFEEFTHVTKAAPVMVMP